MKSLQDYMSNHDELKRKLKLKVNSVPYRIHVYLMMGKSLTHVDTVSEERSPVGLVLNLAPRIKDLRDKFDEAEIVSPLMSFERKRKGKAPYVEYYYKGVGCALEAEAIEDAKRDMHV